MIGVPSLGDGIWDMVRHLISLETQPNDRGLKFQVRVCRDPGGIGKARNTLAHVARCIGASTLLMADRDIRVTAPHVFKLLDHDPAIQLIGALYPLRQTPLAWVGEFMDSTPETLGPGGEWPMWHVGTGLIRVDMSVFDVLIQKRLAPEYEHEDADPTNPIDGQIPYGARIHDFFGMGPRFDTWLGNAADPRPRRFPRYVTEDYMLSYLWRKAGGRCWVDPDCQVGHFGKVDFLELEETIEKRVNAALAKYKMDLRSVGVEVPTLVIDEKGVVSRA